MQLGGVRFLTKAFRKSEAVELSRLTGRPSFERIEHHADRESPVGVAGAFVEAKQRRVEWRRREQV